MSDVVVDLLPRPTRIHPRPATPRTELACAYAVSRHFLHNPAQPYKTTYIVHHHAHPVVCTAAAEQGQARKQQLEEPLLDMMAPSRACMFALVMALAFLFFSDGAAAARTPGTSSAQRRRQVQSLLRRLNKDPLATIEVCTVYSGQ